MSILGCCMVLAMICVQLPASPPPDAFPPPLLARPPDAAGGAPGAPQQDTVRMEAVQAIGTGRAEKQIAPELSPLKGILEQLPFDAFSLVAQQEQALVPGVETALRINDIYSLHVLSGGATESGEIKLDARIEMLQNGTPVNALITSCAAAPGKALVFRGLQQPPGELVVIMTLVQNQNGQGAAPPQDSQENKDEQPEEQNQEQQQQQQAEQEGESQDKQQPPPEASENEQSSAQSSEEEPQDTPKDMHEIEALLKSLEETDRREQPQVFNQRERFESPQEWW